MKTRGRVPKVNVTSTNIRYVADIDYNLGTGMVASEQLFHDNDVRGFFIDPEYCDGDTDQERLEVFQNLPLHSGEWRNYGGEEPGPVNAEPEIYFSSILGMGFNWSDPVEFIPESAEDLQFVKDNNSVLGVAIPPNLMEVDNYVSSTIVESKQLADRTQSAMFRNGAENVLNASNLGIQVGLDYNNPSIKDAVFSYNITTYYGEIPSTIDVGFGKDRKTLLVLFISFLVTATATIGLIKLKVNLAQLFRGLSGPFKETLIKLYKGIDKIASDALGYTFGPILAAIGSYTAMILVADMIWDMAQKPTSVKDGIFKYKNLIDGMYTFDDIKKSKYQLGFGNLFSGTDNFVSKNVSISKDQNIYIVKANETQYPYNEIIGDIVRKKYANFKFFPKCNQYDLMTPPPIITYKIELEAISGCALSKDKITSFIVSIAPDKYDAPVFDVITPYGRATDGIKNVYRNTPIEFVNAKYVDFIGLLDTEKPNGLFTKYYDSFINSDGGNGSFENHYVPLTGTNIVTKGAYIFNRNGLYPDSSIYDIKFLQEQQGNLIKNSTFRMERLSEDPDDPTNLLRKYWTMEDDWEIRDGAIYRDWMGDNTNGFYQSLSSLRWYTSRSNTYYFLDIDCNIQSGYLELDCQGLFDDSIYNWLDSGISNDPAKRVQTDTVPDGLSFGNGNIRFSNSKRYRVILKLSNGAADRKIHFKCSETFIGNVNYLSLQYLSNNRVNENPRNCINALTQYKQSELKVRWNNSIIVSKTINLTFKIIDPGTIVTLKFKPIEEEAQHYKATIAWGDGYNGELNLDYQEYTINHTYNRAGIYNVVFVNTMPQLILKNLYESFVCNSVNLVSYSDVSGLLFNGSVDLSNSNIGNNMNTSSFSTPLYSLDISNTPITGNTDNISAVRQFLDISNTNISGDISSVYNTASLNASNCNVITCYPSNQPSGDNGNKSITWLNENIEEAEFYNLIKSIDLSNITEGYLNISGNNVPITDIDTLNRITMLTTILGEDDGIGGVGRGWTILFNSNLINTDSDLVDSENEYLIDNNNDNFTTI